MKKVKSVLILLAFLMSGAFILSCSQEKDSISLPDAEGNCPPGETIICPNSDHGDSACQCWPDRGAN